MAFATLADLVDRVPADDQALLDNPYLVETLLEEAADLIKSETGQEITAGVSTLTLYGAGRRTLRLPQLPVTAVAVAVDSLVWDVDVDYWWTADGFLWRTSPRAVWDGPVEITYSHGYAVVPEDLKRLNAALALSMLQDRAGIRSVSLGSASVTYLRSATGEVASLTEDHRRILDRYTPLVSP